MTMRSTSGYGWQENQNNWFSPMFLFILIGLFVGWGKAWIAFIIFPVVFGVGVYLFNQYFKKPNAHLAWTPEDIEKYKRGERLEYFDLDKHKNDDEEPLVYYVGDDGELIEMQSEKPKRTDRYDQPPKYV